MKLKISGGGVKLVSTSERLRENEKILAQS